MGADGAALACRGSRDSHIDGNFRADLWKERILKRIRDQIRVKKFEGRFGHSYTGEKGVWAFRYVRAKGFVNVLTGSV